MERKLFSRARKDLRQHTYMEELKTGPRGLLDKMGSLRYPIIFLGYAYAIHTTLNIFLSFVRVSNMLKILDTFSYATRSFFASFSLHQAFNVSTPSKRLQDRFARGGSAKRSLAVSIALKVFILLYFAVQLGLTVDTILERHTEEYVIPSLYGLDVAANGENREYVLAASTINWSFFVALSVVPGLMIADYIALCVHLRQRVTTFKNAVIKTTAGFYINGRELKRHQERSEEVWKDVKRVDDTYSTVVFVWYLDITINVVLCARNLYKGLSAAHFGLDTMYYAVVFLLLSLSASSVDAESKELVREIQQLRRAVDQEDWQANGQILLLESGLQHSRLVLTSGHFCVIDRQSLVVVMGAITTYTVLLVQLATPT